MNKTEYKKYQKIVDDYYYSTPPSIDIFASDVHNEYFNKVNNNPAWTYINSHADEQAVDEFSNMINLACSDCYTIGFIEGFKQGLEYKKLTDNKER